MLERIWNTLLRFRLQIVQLSSWYSTWENNSKSVAIVAQRFLIQKHSGKSIASSLYDRGYSNCSSSTMTLKAMQNTHLEHPEDAILTGDLSVLDWFSESDSFISTKMDGAPAIVWGTNPANGKFFVWHKAVFNRKDSHCSLSR